MFERAWKFRVAGGVLLAGLTIAARPARAQTETSLADLLAGTTVPLTIKLKDLTPEWRRVSLTGETMLGMGGMMQSMMQGIGSMFGGRGAGDALYTRGATVKIGDQQFLVGYRLPAQGLDFAALMAGADGGRKTGDGGQKTGDGSPGPRSPVASPPSSLGPTSELALVLVNVRAIASMSDIRPFNMAEATQPSSPGLLDLIKQESAKPGTDKPAPQKPRKKAPDEKAPVKQQK